MTYEDRQDRKLAHFVDRVPHLRRLEDDVLGLDDGPARLLVFWGVGGQGKSLLLQRFERHLIQDPQYRHVRHARIDFNERREREPWRPLIWIRNALAAQGVRFTRFDLAFALYWSQFPERGRDLPMLTGRWFRLTGETAGAALSDVGSTVTELSVAAVTEGLSASVPFLGRALAFLGRATYDQVERRRLIAANESLAALFSGEHRDALLPPSQIAARLPALLAEDIDAHRQDDPGCRVVLLIDETERVLEQGGAPERRMASEVEDSLRALARRLRGGLMVFAGREPLAWTRDPDLRPRLTGRQIKLGGLPVGDARTLLAKEGVTDPALVDALIAGASAPEGEDDTAPVYPLLIDLQIQHLANLTARGETVDPALLRVDAEGFEDKRTILLDRLLRDYGAPLQGALRHLALCSWIDREVFRCLVRDLGLGVQRDAWRTIASLSFMHRRTDAGEEAVVMHGAVADALALELDARDRAETHAILARHFAARVCPDPTDLRVRLDLLALEAAVEHRIATDEPGLAGWWGDFATMLNDRGRYGDLARLSARLHDHLEAALAPDASEALAILGWWARGREREGAAREVADRLMPVLDQCRDSALDWSDEIAVLTLRQRYATALSSLGRHADAEALGRATLARRERVLGPDHPDTLACASSLASTLWSLGRHADAEVLDRDTLARRERVLGPDHPDTLASASNLASTLWSLGRHADAEVLDRDTLERRERVLGPNHPDTLTSVSNLAKVLWSLGRNADAEALNRDALERRERVLGPDHPDTLTSVSNLAIVLWSLGRHADAEALFRDTLARRERVIGSDHPETLASASNLAVALYLLGRYEDAEVLDSDTLERRERVLGPDHPDTLTSASNLAVTLSALGRDDGAVTVRRKYGLDRSP